MIEPELIERLTRPVFRLGAERVFLLACCKQVLATVIEPTKTECSKCGGKLEVTVVPRPEST
jgi:hypothetical protein